MARKHKSCGKKYNRRRHRRNRHRNQYGGIKTADIKRVILRGLRKIKVL